MPCPFTRRAWSEQSQTAVSAISSGWHSSPPGTEASVSTRVKMGQSSMVYALVNADGKFHIASKEVKVTLGGCGG